MKFYRVTLRGQGEEHTGYQFFTEKREAEQAQRRSNLSGTDNDEHDPKPMVYTDEVEEIQVEPTKKGILAALNLYASHADNG